MDSGAMIIFVIWGGSARYQEREYEDEDEDDLNLRNGWSKSFTSDHMSMCVWSCILPCLCAFQRGALCMYYRNYTSVVSIRMSAHFPTSTFPCTLVKVGYPWETIGFNSAGIGDLADVARICRIQAQKLPHSHSYVGSITIYSKKCARKKKT